MTEPKYKIGDRALVANLSVTIEKTDYLALSGKSLYLVRFDRDNLLLIVDESDLSNERTKV